MDSVNKTYTLKRFRFHSICLNLNTHITDAGQEDDEIVERTNLCEDEARGRD